MTIRKGEAWGTSVDRPLGLRVVNSDAELAQLVGIDADGAYGVAAGDLHRTVGAPTADGDRLHRLPIDLLDVTTESSDHVAVAHVVIRRGWWRGPIVAICNVDHVGRWNVAPRAHPNDGRFDVVEVSDSMSVRDRWEARRRLPTGTHVPHPAIASRTATEWAWTGTSGAGVWVDGVCIGDRRSVRISIRPDAAAIHV